MDNTEAKLRDYLKRATADLRTVKRRLREVEDQAAEPIAIVGMACRFPGGVRGPEDLWTALVEGRDLMGPFPTDRGWDLDTLYDPTGERRNSSYVNEGAFLEDVALFDAGFFGISPREALAMDPQQRLLLETTWECFERAGIDPTTLRGSQTGVYLGATDHDYGRGMTELPEEIEGNVMIGRSGAISSGRIAYFLGLHGPAVTIDTMCSSSLVALHLACEGLRRGDCSMAVTGGTTVLSTPEGYTEFSRQGALARDGRCKAFAASADGTGWAEGVGVVILERLSDARRNGHRILALVRGSAINQDGASNGLTAPNGTAQRKVILQALANARVSADEVDAVEAHGTGTTLGDPIEAHALLATYGQNRETPLWLGSLKSNLGHAAAAAGVAGVIKMVLALRHGLLPKTLHVDEPSPKIDWSSGAVSLLTEAREWPRNGRPRRAGVSAFGASGTNAHAILEEAPEPEPQERPQLTKVSTGALPWVVSGRSADALRAQARRLKGAANGSVQDIGYSLARTRATFEHRAVIIGSDREDMLAGLEAVALGQERDGVVRGVAADLGKAVFVFPGQGAQWAGMAVELLETSPVFAARLRECHDALAPFTDWSLLDVLRDQDDTTWLERVDMVQPALWAVMVSLAALWRACGVEPAAVIGHSQGEIAAAVVAGGLSLEDGARVVALRSKAIRAIAGLGGMMSVQLSREQALPHVTDGLSLAAVNGSGSVVISGDNEALDALQAKLEADGVRVRRVPVDYASHSAHVERIHAELLDVLGPITPKTGGIPFYSTVTVEQIDTATVDAEYWYRNLRQTVELEETTKLLVEHGHDVFIEVSPHSVLLPALGETLDALGRDGVTVGSLRRDQGGMDRFLASVAELHARGGNVAWTSVFDGQDAEVVDLPTYAFQRRRYWLEAPQKQVEQTAVVDSGLDSDFWQAVEQGDAAALASTIGLDTDKPLSALLPDLAAWRARRREQSIVDSWRYRVDWVPIDEPAPAKLDGTWLMLVPVDAGYDALRARVRAAVEQHGGQPVVLELAEGETDRELLAKRLRELSGPVRGVLSLLALDQRWHVTHRGLPNGLAATLGLIQALGDAEIDAPLWLVTSGVGQDRNISPAQAAVWGLGRVAALEFSQRWGGMVDVPQNLDDAAINRLAGVLAGHGDEDQVAVRPNGLYARRLVRVASENVPLTWKPQDCVLLTGGTGGVGAQIARWLAKQRARRLVLTSRRGLDAPGARELVAELAEHGTEAIVVACDVGDEQALIDLKRRMEADGWPITSVMHIAGAGVLNGLDRTDLDEFADTAYAKIAGAAVLDAVFDTDEVAEFILFSSISAVWGSGDHGAYAAANAYLDGLAESRRARGRPALSLVWGIWDPAEGGGMAANLVEQALRDRGIPFMNPRLAIDGFHKVLSDQNRAVEVVAAVDWSKFVPVFTAGRPSPLLETIPEVRTALQKERAAAEKASANEATLKERLATLSPAERSLTVTAVVREQVAAALKYPGPEAVETTRAFRELGFDSLTAVDLRNRLGEVTGLRFPVTVVFDHPNVVELAKHVEKQLVPVEDPLAGAGISTATASSAANNETLALLSTISLDRLREAGLLDTLLRMANGTEEEQEHSDIDDMDVNALVAMALETDN